VINYIAKHYNSCLFVKAGHEQVCVFSNWIYYLVHIQTTDSQTL